MWYRHRRPTRDEVAAAMEVYKPYMKPEQDIYKPGVCWSIVPAKGGSLPQKEHLCGGPAMLYQMQGSAGYNAIISRAWLCMTHARRAEEKGYTLIKIT